MFGIIPRGFFEFSGRTAIWGDAWNLIKESPYVGYGFHADRLLLGTHVHNSLMHALLQTGMIGAAFFTTAMLFGWGLFIGQLRNLNRLPSAHKNLVIQAGGVLAFLTMRSFPESSGAFFGIDWLILAPLLFYLHVVSRASPSPIRKLPL